MFTGTEAVTHQLAFPSQLPSVTGATLQMREAQLEAEQAG